jgi:hypothetical protein
MNTVTEQQFFEFYTEWSLGKYPNLRFGQAFCNKFNITDSEVFYSNDHEALLMEAVKNKYVKKLLTE